MAKRLSTGFTNEVGDDFVIDIYDDNWSGSSTDCQVDGTGFTMSYNSDFGNYTGGFIITSTCVINLIANIQAVIDLIAVLPVISETDLRISISKNGSFWWGGLILPDVVKMDDLPAGALPIFQIRAVDGIARLKTIDYNDAGVAYTGKQTIVEHLLNALNKIGSTDLWTSNTFLSTHLNWLADGHAAGINPSVFTRTRLRHLNFLRIDQTGQITYRNCYDVLKEFCKTFNCNLFLSDGKFWFVNPTMYLQTLSTLGRHDFTKAGVVTYTIGFITYYLVGRKSNNPASYNIFRFTGGFFEYLPALDKTVVQYRHFSTRNLTPGLQGTGGSFVATTIDDIDSVGGTARLMFRGNLNFRVDFVTPGDAQVTHGKFRIQIKIGDYYLSRPVTFINTLYIIEEAPFWTLSTAYYEIIVPIFEDATNYTNVIEFITPPIPEDGDMIVYFVLLEITDNAGNSFTTLVTVPTTSLTNIYSEILLAGTIEGQYNITEFTATNDADGNADEAIIQTLIGDGPTGSTFGALDIYDGANWIPSADGWRYGGGGTYYPISQILANEVMYRHKKPAEKFTADWQGEYNPWRSVIYVDNSVQKTYLFTGGSFTAATSIWTLNLVLFAREASGVTVETEEVRTWVGSDGEAPPEIQPGGGIVPSDNGLTQTAVEDSGAGVENGLASGVIQGLVPMRTELLYQPGDAMNTIDTPVLGASFSYLLEDRIIVIDSNTGQSQDFIVEDDSLQGDGVIGVFHGDTADYRYNTNAFVFHDPRFLLELLGFMRRYRQEIHLVDYDADIVTANPLPGFWRAEVSSNIDVGKSFFLYGRRIQNIYIKIGQAVSNLTTVTYSFDIRRNGTILKTVTFNGQATSVFTDLNGIEANIPATALYTFSVTRTDGTGGAASKGLMVCFVIV